MITSNSIQRRFPDIASGLGYWKRSSEAGLKSSRVQGRNKLASISCRLMIWNLGEAR